MTLLVTGYRSKRELSAAIGQPLAYQEISLFGPEFTPNGSFVVAHRPRVTGLPGREFFALVTMRDGLIEAVS